MVSFGVMGGSSSEAGWSLQHGEVGQRSRDVLMMRIAG